MTMHTARPLGWTLGWTLLVIGVGVVAATLLSLAL